jgi:HAD superfamily hydrolase (TIGR01549 family)
MKFYEQPENWAVAPGAIEAFRRLRSRGIKVVVTSNWDDRLPNILEKLSITDEVDAVYCSAIGGFEKPHPNAFKHSLAAIDITDESDFKTVVHVGDSDVNDILGAQNVGIGYAIKWGGDRENARAFPAFDFQELADEMIASVYAFGDAESTRRYF